MSLVQIATACAVECERQQVGIRELGQLVKAYDKCASDDDAFIDINSFQLVGSIVEPNINRFGFRTTPVTFTNGGSSADANDIPRHMNNLIGLIVDMWNGEPIEVDDVVKEFLWIHPFRDGNGRVGWLLQNHLDGTFDNPQPLRRHF